MKLYICTPEEDIDFAFDRRKIVEEVLRKYRASVVDSGIRDVRHPQAVTPMRSVHGFVLDSRCDHAELAYVLAFAAVQKKPILYIASIRSDLNDLRVLLGKSRIPEQVVVDDGTLEGFDLRVKTFIDKYVSAQVYGDEIPSLKFTLRITPKLDRFLQSQVKGTSLSKADYVRGLVLREVEKGNKAKKILKASQK